MPLIYLVDDDENIRRLASVALTDAGMEVESFSNGVDFLEKVKEEPCDLVLLDWMMPRPDGLEVLKELKADSKTKKIPVIILSAKSSEMDIVLGLELGADAYITKPFGVRELPARVRAVLRSREYNPDPKQDQVITRGNLTIDKSKRKVYKHSETIDLSAKEFDLLFTLMQHPGQVLSRDTLLNRVWDTDYFGDTRTVDVHVRYLRQKIEDNPSDPKYVLTVRGVGYTFTDETD